MQQRDAELSQMWALVVATGAAVFVCATASSASSSYAVSALDNSVVVGIDADTGFIVTVGVGKVSHSVFSARLPLAHPPILHCAFFDQPPVTPHGAPRLPNHRAAAACSIAHPWGRCPGVGWIGGCFLLIFQNPC